MQVSKRILIVDRDPAIHAFLDVILKSGDRVIESAQSAAEALELLKTKEFDLVLVDISPGPDGATFLQQLQAASPNAAVVIMTAQRAPSVAEFISSKAFGYISKPFASETMTDLVNSALRWDRSTDDITVLSGKPEWITLRIPCKLSVVDRLSSFFSEILSDLGPDVRDTISGGLRELLLNAVEHGGKSDPSQMVHLTFIRTARSLIYIIRDPGEGFSFDKLPHAAITNNEGAPIQHVQARNEMGIRPGGFGILISQNVADELLYSDKGNEVMFVKYLDQQSVAQ